jgi:hypothetical protein
MDGKLQMKLSDLQQKCHNASYAAGWWHHPMTRLPYIPGDRTVDGRMWWSLATLTREMIEHYWPFVLAAKIALIHSEVSEGLEALRTNAPDDKLPHRSGLETELADSVIRSFDIAGAMERKRLLNDRLDANPFDLSAAIVEKMAFNVTRPDHTIAARNKANGKAF